MYEYTTKLKVEKSFLEIEMQVNFIRLELLNRHVLFIYISNRKNKRKLSKTTQTSIYFDNSMDFARPG